MEMQKILYVFDFDGVILNSHKVKTDAFYDIFKLYGKNVANKAKKFHERNFHTPETFRESALKPR